MAELLESMNPSLLAELRDAIPAPITRPEVLRLAFLSGLQAALHAGEPIGLPPVVATLGQALRTLRVGVGGTDDWGQWEPVICTAATAVEVAIAELARRSGAPGARVATTTGSRHFVVQRLNQPMRHHLESLRSARMRAEDLARTQQASTATAHPELGTSVVESAALTADLARWWDGRGLHAVISSTGQINSWSAAVVHAERTHAALLRTQDLVALQVERHGDA
ncbi:MAG: hypothetical protein KA224_06030 [Steroidobacteraceae bacterium]|nr:hypothetical protein [Steroidobacteraceae bacterium]MCC7200713.1 hypothetical protein [Gammaproteobacteria bacterium]